MLHECRNNPTRGSAKLISRFCERTYAARFIQELSSRAQRAARARGKGGNNFRGTDLKRWKYVPGQPISIFKENTIRAIIARIEPTFRQPRKEKPPCANRAVVFVTVWRLGLDRLGLALRHLLDSLPTLDRLGHKLVLVLPALVTSLA
jgi:hypothetical protein